MTPTARQLVLASGNRGKLREFDKLLQPLGWLVQPQSAFGIEPPEETESSFRGNALLKARHAALHSHQAALADDSGLEVDALGGAPGVYSARYAGAEASDADNLAKLLAAMATVPEGQRRARFRCVIAFVRSADDPEPIIGEGVWEGYILTAPRGLGGFGYDPVFADGQTHTSAAEMSSSEKNLRSHRAMALRDFLSRSSPAWAALSR
jgi:XTP/dITP diphosphohydrolase